MKHNTCLHSTVRVQIVGFEPHVRCQRAGQPCMSLHLVQLRTGMRRCQR
jgi:hypothetical protein